MFSIAVMCTSSQCSIKIGLKARSKEKKKFDGKKFAAEQSAQIRLCLCAHFLLILLATAHRNKFAAEQSAQTRFCLLCTFSINPFGHTLQPPT